jgi:hypothetical protein
VLRTGTTLISFGSTIRQGMAYEVSRGIYDYLYYTVWHTTTSIDFSMNISISPQVSHNTCPY